MPYVFSEYGITMLAGILKSEVAVSMSLKIVNEFIEMRKYIKENLIEQKNINNQVIKNTEDIKLIQKSLDKMNKEKEYDGIFFKGQVYDSYSLLITILNKAKKKITIIDNYIDKNLLDILRNINIDILIITNKYNNQDYTKYQTQYNNITLKINNNIHDRFIILDNKELYHVGASLKDLVKKCFAINKIDSNKWLKELLKEVGGIK